MSHNNVAKRLKKQRNEEQRLLQLDKAVNIAKQYKTQYEMLAYSIQNLHSGTLHHEMIYDLILFMIRTLKRGDRSIVIKVDPDPGKNDFIYAHVDRYESTCRKIFWELLKKIEDKHFYELIRGMCEHEAFMVRDQYIRMMEEQCYEIEDIRKHEENMKDEIKGLKEEIMRLKNGSETS